MCSIHFSYASTDTSSYNSECHDDEEIALAIQAAELAARREARSRFKSSSDLIHRLFVCISGMYIQYVLGLMSMGQRLREGKGSTWHYHLLTTVTVFLYHVFQVASSM